MISGNRVILWNRKIPEMLTSLNFQNKEKKLKLFENFKFQEQWDPTSPKGCPCMFKNNVNNISCSNPSDFEHTNIQQLPKEIPECTKQWKAPRAEAPAEGIALLLEGRREHSHGQDIEEISHPKPGRLRRVQQDLWAGYQIIGQAQNVEGWWPISYCHDGTITW